MGRPRLLAGLRRLAGTDSGHPAFPVGGGAAGGLWFGPLARTTARCRIPAVLSADAAAGTGDAAAQLPGVPCVRAAEHPTCHCAAGGILSAVSFPVGSRYAAHRRGAERGRLAGRGRSLDDFSSHLSAAGKGHRLYCRGAGISGSMEHVAPSHSTAST